MRSASCPKHMQFGPCGGTRSDGTCEVDPRPCPFLGPDHEQALREAASSTTRRTPVPLALADPAIVVDVRAPAAWPGDERVLWREVARSLPGCAALLGEHVDNPRGDDDAGAVDPTVAIEELASAGVTVIATVTGRDRDLPAATTTMQRYISAGATAIHCVTGDHPQALSIDRPAVFGAEAVTLVALANDLGVPATVGESPASPGARTTRVVLKHAAGASAVIFNHAGDVSDLDAVASACRAQGVDVPLLAPVPMVADLRAAAALVRFPGLRLPQRIIDAVSAPDDVAASALTAAAAMAAELALGGRYAGVNLSGSASSLDPYARIKVTMRFVDAVRTAWTDARRRAGAERPRRSAP